MEILERKNIFIQKSLKKHRDKFCYKEVDYKNIHKLVKIKCIKHNIIFEQTPNLHISSDHCCPICIREYKSITSPLRKNREKFIENAKKVFGDKYDYSKVNYINNKTPVVIIYNDVEYLQRPDSHLTSRCPELEWKKNLSTEQFIEKAIKVHGNKYHYNNVNYIDTKTKVKIICTKHGIFEQTPNSHLSGNGCSFCSESYGESLIRNYLEYNNILFEFQKSFPDCKNTNVLSFDFYLLDYNICIEFDGIQHKRPVDFFGGIDAFKKAKINDNIKTEYCEKNNIKLIRISNKKNIENKLSDIMSKYNKASQEEKNKKFIEKSETIWGYKYDYSKIKYIDSKTSVTIIYKGVEYQQTPTKHLQKKLCELSNNSLSRKEFIRRCVEKWGNRFDYTDTLYRNSYSNINFYDRHYGIYVSQKANSHMNGNLYNLSKENFIELSNINFKYKYDYSKIEYKGITKEVIIICKLHGEFITRAYNHYKNIFGGSCKKCDEYLFTKKVFHFLDKNNISNDKFHRFNDLPLPFDFYIPSIRTCIEFDGRQHFEPIEHFGGLEAYNNLKINDSIKNDYCEENYINLLRIRYDQIDNIETLLNNSLKLAIRNKQLS